MFAACLAQWLDHHATTWAGFDLDRDHRSFSRLFPGTVEPIEIGQEPVGDFVKVLRRLGAGPVVIFDLRAHMASLWLEAAEITQFTSMYAKAGGRVTAVLFPSDDLEVMSHLDTTVSQLGNTVDYLVVRNLGRSAYTRMLDGSELETELKRLKAGFLELPALISVARNCIAAKETEAGRDITPVEIVGNKELGMDPMTRIVVEHWLRTVFRRLDSVAHLLLPTLLAEKIQAVTTSEPSTYAPNPRGARLNFKGI